MNFVRKITGIGASNDGSVLLLEPVSPVKPVNVQITYEIHIKTITKGDREITKGDLIKQLLLEYRGPSEKKALYELGTVLSYSAWIKNKTNSGFGFRGLFNVNAITENLRIDDQFSYERFFLMEIKGWSFTCEVKIESLRTSKGSNFSKMINDFFDKIQLLKAVRVENNQLLLT
ncbi:matrix [Bimbo virus]|uniref:Matrix n=1 Tax=Bimbo virus TaxID=864694 RepID=A0AAE8XBM0_9RHAB|nr:matrix [Bimbo virus]UAU42870.1 matrix [Bimbo virus]WAD86853.1 matrix [Bimbo virus]